MVQSIRFPAPPPPLAQVLTATTNANGVATVSFTSAVVGISDVLASAPTAPSRTSTITWVKPVNSAPSCQLATATPGALWPPNHKLAPVTVSVPDVDGDEVTVEITSVRRCANLWSWVEGYSLL